MQMQQYNRVQLHTTNSEQKLSLYLSVKKVNQFAIPLTESLPKIS